MDVCLELGQRVFKEKAIMDKVMLKNGKAHPDLECKECSNAIYYDYLIYEWKCSFCSWREKGSMI